MIESGRNRPKANKQTETFNLSLSLYNLPFKRSSSYKLMFRNPAVFRHFLLIRQTSNGCLGQNCQRHIYTPMPFICACNEVFIASPSKVITNTSSCFKNPLFWYILADSANFQWPNLAKSA